MSDPRATAAVTGTAHKYAALQLHRRQQEDKKNTILDHLSYSRPLSLATKLEAQKTPAKDVSGPKQALIDLYTLG